MSQKSILEPNEKMINLIMSQTTLSKEETIIKLAEFNNDVLAVIKDFMGISNTNNNIKTTKKSLNQEVFRQMRKQIDIKDYWNKNPIDVNNVIQNFQESEERKKEDKQN